MTIALGPSTAAVFATPRVGMRGRMRLLVVDDNSVFRDELSDFLLSEGHEVATAPSAAAAFEILERNPCDVLLTDLKMPRQNGLELLRIVRDRWPSVLSVMITGRAAVDSAVEAMKLGAFDYIAKPFRTEQIREMLRLAEEERSFVGASDVHRDTDQVLRHLAESGTTVLVARHAPGAAIPGVTEFPFDGGDLARLRDAALAFLTGHPAGGIVLPEVDRMLKDHREGDVVALIGELRERIASRGPLVVGFDPSKVAQTAASALRAVVAGPVVHGAIEAMANPIRRRVLTRLEEGPASFSETMRAAGLEDSPKLSFHLHRLVEAGLVGKSEEEYRLTPAGAEAVATLRRMEKTTAEKGARDFVFLADGGPPTARRGTRR